MISVVIPSRRYQAKRLAAALATKLSETLAEQHLDITSAFQKIDADGSGTITVQTYCARQITGVQ